MATQTPTHLQNSTLDTDFTMPPDSETGVSQLILSQWIRRRRKSLDLTQAELAHKLACSVSTIQKVEEGDRRPSKNLIASLVKVLEIPEEQHQAFARLVRSRVPVATVGAANDNPKPSSSNTSNSSIKHLPVGSAMIGRKQEADALHNLLMMPTARIITLTGGGGVGKTLLAQRAAMRAAQLFNDVCYVSLVGLPPQANPELASTAVVVAIASALGCGEQSDRAEAQVISRLRDVTTLLILDHFEPVLAACDLLIRLTQVARGLKLLITSRERLRLYAEHVVHLEGLPVFMDQSDLMAPIPAKQSPAVQLFLARANRLRKFPFTSPEDLEQIAQICRWVDGVPLGIELAAELTATHTLDEIYSNIQCDLSVLRTTAPDVPAGQRSMGAVYESSWRLLSPVEQSVLAQCAVFQGEFTFEAATQVIQHAQCDRARLRATLDALIEKSLLRRALGHQDSSRRGCYTLPNLLRHFLRQISEISDDAAA